MEKYINRMPVWSRRILALPAAFLGIFITGELFTLITPEKYTVHALALMKDWGATQYWTTAIAIITLEQLIKMAIFVIIICSFIPYKKFAAAVATGIFFVISSLLYVAQKQPVFSLFLGPLMLCTTIIFFSIYTRLIYKKMQCSKHEEAKG